MSIWTPTIDLADEASPLSVRIARAIVDDIRRGRLRPGTTLPGSRTLASMLGVHRNTVLSAYAALAAEAWLETESARVTRVARALPEAPPRRFSRKAPVRMGIPDAAPYTLGEAPPVRERAIPRGAIALLGGMPDLMAFPVEPYARALRRALRTRRQALLDYSDPYGLTTLRRAIAEMVSARRGVAAKEENVLVTRGSQGALDLLARALVTDTSVIAVESMGYAPAWEAFRAAGHRVVPVPVDEDGIDVAALEALCVRENVRAVYVTPHHQYPSTVALTPARRLALLALARRHRLCIVEDDYDHEFHYEGRSILPLASADLDGVVAYVGTLSKLLAPGLRAGFVVGPRALITHLGARRSYIDRQGDLTHEAALAELLDDGTVAAHARRQCVSYRARRDALVEALHKHFGGAVTFEVPRGGLALWARLDGLRGVDRVCEFALARGVLVQRTRTMCFDGRDRPYLRIGFAGNTPVVLREGVRKLSLAFSEAR
jgi:GntR family transcriptional regulator/MocR family aminotransferase